MNDTNTLPTIAMGRLIRMRYSPTEGTTRFEHYIAIYFGISLTRFYLQSTHKSFGFYNVSMDDLYSEGIMPGEVYETV